MGYAFDALWQTLQQPLETFAGSEFFAALFGALAGALSAFAIGRYSDHRAAVLSEIGACNAGIALAHNVINTALTLKDQYVGGMLASYQRQFAEFSAADEQALRTGIPDVYEAILDLRTLSKAFMPKDELQDITLDRIKLSAVVPMLGVIVKQVIESLYSSLDGRNEVIKEMVGKPTSYTSPRYFGFRDSQGHIDERFPDFLLAISMQTDDCVYFAMLLQDVLVDHGRTLRKTVRFKTPGIMTFNYEKPRVKGLLPAVSEYSDFERQFRPKFPEPFDGPAFRIS